VTSIDLQKADLRTKMLKVRKAITSEDFGQALKDNFLSQQQFVTYKTVAAYWPMAGELDIRPLLEAICERGQQCALPEVEKKHAPLIFRQWQPDDELIAGMHNTLQPVDSAPVIRPDLILVPLLGFDVHGGRLGFGGGYYDRTLAAFAPIKAVGIAYDEQQVDDVPMDQYDQRMNWIVTPGRVIEVSG